MWKATKLLRNRKGFNDSIIIFTLAAAFIALGVILPFIHEDLSSASYSSPDVAGLEDQVSEDVASVSTLNAFTVLFSLGSMFFWTFGSVPVIIDLLILLPLRLLFWFTLARNIWVGGGA